MFAYDPKRTFVLRDRMSTEHSTIAVSGTEFALHSNGRFLGNASQASI